MSQEWLKPVYVEACENYKIYVEFNDWIKGEVQVIEHPVWVFRKFLDPIYFRGVYIPHDHTAIAWDDYVEIDADSCWMELSWKHANY